MPERVPLRTRMSVVFALVGPILGVLPAGGLACARTPPRSLDNAVTPREEPEDDVRDDATQRDNAANADAGADAMTDDSAASGTPKTPMVNAGEPSLIPVAGFGDAIVVVPKGRGPFPLLLAAHGAGDGPEWQCDYWGKPLSTRYVVLCPRGTSLGKGSDGYYFKDHFALEREVLAAVQATKAALGSRLSAGGGVYVAYSQGATMGALMLVDHGSLFPHLLLIEGGSGEWTGGRARRFRATGGKSVAILCGTSPCARRAKKSEVVLVRAGLRARAEHVEGGGHAYWGAVGERGFSLIDDWLLAER